MPFEIALEQSKRLFVWSIVLLIGVAVLARPTQGRHVHQHGPRLAVRTESTPSEGGPTKQRKAERQARARAVARRQERMAQREERMAAQQKATKKRAAKRAARQKRLRQRARRASKGKWGLALPIRRTELSPHKISNQHHDYPAWDVDVKRGTPVFAIRGGKVIDRYKRRTSCGRGLTIRAVDGYSYTYCHAHKVLRREGKRVKAGQIIMRSGTSGNSTGTHLHVQVQGPRGKLQCPQRLIRQRYHGKRVPTWTTRPRGCVGR